MTSGGGEVDVGGATAKTMHWTICSSALLQFRALDVNVIEITRLDW